MIVELPTKSTTTGREGALAGSSIPHPARIALVNLMPDAEATERRFARVFARTPHKVEFVALGVDGHDLRCCPETAPQARSFDGLLITGAPLEGRIFGSVGFWPGLVRIFDCAAARGIPSLFVGWSAQAALYHRHGIGPSPLRNPAPGIVGQEVLAPCSPYLAGVGRRFSAPVTRRTKVRWAALAARRGLTALAASPQTGLSLIEEPATRSLMLFDQLELEACDLRVEESSSTDWNRVAALLFGNWLGEATRRCRAVA